MLSKLYATSVGLPNWVRAVSIAALPLLAFATNASLGSALAVPLFVVFVLLTVFVLFAHLPVLTFDGPLPFSERGVHVRGEVHPWDTVVVIAPAGERDLEGLLTDGSRIRLRARGARTRQDLQVALQAYRPDLARF